MRNPKKKTSLAAPAAMYAHTFAGSIPLSANQKSRIVSLVEARIAAEKHIATLNDSIKMILATIIECSGGDPAANYALVDNASRLEMQR